MDAGTAVIGLLLCMQQLGGTGQAVGGGHWALELGSGRLGASGHWALSSGHWALGASH
jgi:hypothetical protein